MATEEAVVAYAIEYPAHGQVRVKNELRKQGVLISPSGVGAAGSVMIWQPSKPVWKPSLPILTEAQV